MSVYSLPSVSLPPLSVSLDSMVERSRAAEEHPPLDPLAAERWNVEKKRMEMDAEIEAFYNAEISKCIHIEGISNKKAMKLYNDLYYKIKWSNPPIPGVHGKLMVGYCGHLLNVGSKTPYPHEVDMVVWSRKAKGTKVEKVTMECTGMCNRMFKIIDKRDSDIEKTQLHLLNTTDKMNIKKDGHLRYMMESNRNARDEYFSIWYLAANNKTRELDVLLNSRSKLAQYSHGIDTPDPDFGITALLYAIKAGHWGPFELLLRSGANPNIRAPDGRTTLHYAAAYSSKEMVLELLGLGVSYEATDNYGCTAVDLAGQNLNKRTYNVLLNWNHLVPAMSDQAGQEDVASFMYAGGDSRQLPPLPSHFLSAGLRESGGSPRVEGSRSLLLLGDEPNGWGETVNLEASQSGMVSSPQQAMGGEGGLYPLGADHSLDMQVPEEYTVTADETIAAMSPMLRLLTRRLETCNKYVDRRARSGRAVESEAYFLKRSATGMLDIQASMHMSLNRSMVMMQSRSTSQLPEAQEYHHQQQQQLAITQSGSEECAAEPSEELGEGERSEWPPAEEGWNPTEAFFANTAETMRLIDAEVNGCLVEIRQCTKHYHMCVAEGFLEEALRSLKRRWLCSKELLVLHVRREQYLVEEWTTLHHNSQEEEEQQSEMNRLNQQQMSSTSFLAEPSQDNTDARQRSDDQHDEGDDEEDASHKDEGNMQLFEVRTNAQESAANMAYNAQFDRIDLGRLALNFEESLRRVVYLPSTELFNENDGHLKTNSVASNQYLEERRARDGLADFPEDQLHLLEPVVVAGEPKTPRTPGKKKLAVRYVDGAYEQVTSVPHSSYTTSEEGGDGSEASRGQAISDLAKDVLRLDSQSNIYYEAAEYVSKMKHHRDISPLDLILVIQEQARQRPTFFRPTRDSEAADTTVTASQSQPRDDALSISTRGETLTTAPSLMEGSMAGSFQNKVSVRYLLTLGVELCDTHLARREEGAALKVLEDCCMTLDPHSPEFRASNDVDLTSKIRLLTRKCDLLLTVYRYLVSDTHLKSSSATRQAETERALAMWKAAQYVPVLDATASASLTVSGGSAAVHLMNAEIEGWDCNLLLSADWIIEQQKKVQQRNLKIEEEQLRWTMQAEAERLRLLQEQEQLLQLDGIPEASQTLDNQELAESEGSQFQPVKDDGSASSVQLQSGAGDDQSYVNLEESQEMEPRTQGSIDIIDVDRGGLLTSQLAAQEEEEVQVDWELLWQHREAVLDGLLSNARASAEHAIQLHSALYHSDLVEPFTLAQALQTIAHVHDLRGEGAEALVYMQHAEIAAVRAVGGAAEESLKVALEALRLFVKYHLMNQADLKYVYGRCNEILRHIKEYSRVNLKAADALNKTCTELLAVSTVVVAGGGVFDSDRPHKRLTVSACNRHAIMKKYSTSTYSKQFFHYKKM